MAAQTDVFTVISYFIWRKLYWLTFADETSDVFCDGAYLYYLQLYSSHFHLHFAGHILWISVPVLYTVSELEQVNASNPKFVEPSMYQCEIW